MIALPPKLAVNVAVPVTVPFTVAVYVPLPLSVTALSVSAGPDVFTTVSVPPLALKLLPAASFNWMVSVLVVVPSAVMLVGLAVTVDVARLAPVDVPVAVIASGDPPSPVDVTVRVFRPAEAPRVHDPTVAMPLAFVDCVPPVTDPPPVVAAKVTATPGTALPYWSVTLTLGAVGTAVDAAALCAFPALTTSVVAVLADEVTLKVTGDPVSAALVAVAVLVPTLVPSVQPPTVAIPCALVFCVTPVMLPPPLVTANVTSTPATGFPAASFTMTAGFVATTAPTVPATLPA